MFWANIDNLLSIDSKELEVLLLLDGSTVLVLSHKMVFGLECLFLVFWFTSNIFLLFRVLPELLWHWMLTPSTSLSFFT